MPGVTVDEKEDGTIEGRLVAIARLAVKARAHHHHDVEIGRMRETVTTIDETGEAETAHAVQTIVIVPPRNESVTTTETELVIAHATATGSERGSVTVITIVAESVRTAPMVLTAKVSGHDCIELVYANDTADRDAPPANEDLDVAE